MSDETDFDELIESSTSAEQAKELAKLDPDFLGGLAMPSVWKYNLPPVFLMVWSWLTQEIHQKRRFSRLALGLPRGFGKTTVIKLFCLYAILFSNRKFILILSKTEAKAANIISDIMDFLEEPNIRKLFGYWKQSAQRDASNIKVFAFRGRPIIIAGLGAGGSVRGLNLKNARPDLIIFEDVQDREDADSKGVSDGIYNWMLGTALKAKDPAGCMALFVANMYPTPHSILKKLQTNPYWTSLIQGGILQDPATGEMTSLWEDLQPLEQLLEEFAADNASGHPEIFYAEVLNDPNAATSNLYQRDKLPTWDIDDHDPHAGNFIVIDPASGNEAGDDVSIGYFQVHEAKPVFWDVEYGKFSPGVNVLKAIKMAIKYNCSLIVIEGNAYQASLGYWMRVTMDKLGIQGIQIVPMFSGKTAKNTRILNMFKEVASGDTRMHPRVLAHFESQAKIFNALKTKNTDGILDLVTYAPRVLSELADYLRNLTILNEQDMQALEMSMFDMDPVLALSPA